jgi:hypothetical protein
MADPLRNSIATHNCNASKGDRNIDPGRCEMFHEHFITGKKGKIRTKRKQRNVINKHKSNTKKQGWKIGKEKRKK